RKQVSRARLGGQVVGAEGRGADRDGPVPGDDDADGAQRVQLLGVVGQHAERRRDAEKAAGGGDLVVAPLIVPQPETLVRLEGGEAMAARLYQHAVARLGSEARAAAFLGEIE